MIDQAAVPVTNPDVLNAISQLSDLLKGAAQVGSQATVSGFIVMAIQWAKKSKYIPWVRANTQRINQALSVGLAMATSLGINHIWNPQTRVLAITIPTLAVFLAAASHVGHGVLLNEGIYRAFVKKATDAEVRATHLIEQAGKAEAASPVEVERGVVRPAAGNVAGNVGVPVPVPVPVRPRK